MPYFVNFNSKSFIYYSLRIEDAIVINQILDMIFPICLATRGSGRQQPAPAPLPVDLDKRFWFLIFPLKQATLSVCFFYWLDTQGLCFP